MNTQQALLLARVVLLTAAWLLPASTNAQVGRLWVVSDSGCPLVDFDELQPAIDAAAEGDVILVRPRTTLTVYQPFTIDGKSLAIISDGSIPSPTVIDGTIRNIGVGQQVLVHGIRSGGTLTIADNQGPVLIEDSLATGSPSTGQPAALVSNSASVIFSNSSVRGSTGAVLGNQTGEGLRVEGSQVTLYGGTYMGGGGTIAGLTGPVASGGKDGIYVDNQGTVIIIGATVRGGSGGLGANATIPPWGLGGPGGTALNLDGPGARAFLIAARLLEGPGGMGGCLNYPTPQCFSFHPSGPIGTTTAGTGTITQLPGEVRFFTADTPAFDQEDARFGFLGEPGDVALVYAAFAQNHVFFPQWAGVLAPKLGAGGFVPLVEPISATGTLSRFLPMAGEPIPRGTAYVLYTQGLFIESTGRILISLTGSITVLNRWHDPLDGCDAGTEGR